MCPLREDVFCLKRTSRLNLVNGCWREHHKNCLASACSNLWEHEYKSYCTSYLHRRENANSYFGSSSRSSCWKRHQLEEKTRDKVCGLPFFLHPFEFISVYCRRRSNTSALWLSANTRLSSIGLTSTSTHTTCAYCAPRSIQHGGYAHNGRQMTAISHKVYYVRKPEDWQITKCRTNYGLQMLRFTLPALPQNQ